jgi:uncharacterized membrane protein
MFIKLKKYALYLLIAMYAFGAPGFVWFPAFFAPFTPFTLLFTTFVFLVYQQNTTAFWLSFLSVSLIGFISEVIGVKTGLLFGNYHYGNALGYKILEVPLVISLNWALLATASLQCVAHFFKPSVLIPLIAALLATAIDIIMEQVVTRLDFWYFSSGKAGWHNYLGWLCVATLAGFFFQKNLINKGSFKIALLMLLLQVYFFGVIYFLN